MMPVLRRALALLCFLVLAPAGAAAQYGPEDSREVVEIRFDGAHTFDHDELRAAIVTRASACKLPVPLSVVCLAGAARQREYLDPAMLAADALRVRIFYFQRGYREAEVQADTVPAGDGVRVVFQITEGRPTRVATVEVLGAEGFLPPDIADQLPLRVGEPFNLLAAEAARDSLVNALRNRGYPRAEVLLNTDIPAGLAEAHVQFDLIPGTLARFGEIEIEGNRRISESVIRRMLAFDEGDVYRERDLLESQSDLFGLGVFQNVSIRPGPDPTTDTIIPVRIQVNEGFINRVRLGAGLNTADCVTAEGRLLNRNFLGGARRLEIRGALSNVLTSRLAARFPCTDARADEPYGKLTGSIAADFTQPWLFGPRNTLGAGLFFERRSVPGVFVRDARGGHLTVSRLLSARTTVALGLRPELTKLHTEGNLFFCVSFVACAFDDLEVLDDPHWLNPIVLSFGRDRSNSIFSPSRGYIVRLDAEVADPATGSDFGYARLAGDFSVYHGMGRGVVLASRIRSGIARVTATPGEAKGLGLNPQKRFFAGGANSVRGFAEYRLGPKVLTVDAQDRLVRPREEGGAGCSIEEVNDGSCDPSPLGAGDFLDVRPVGGDLLLEGSVELRFPIANQWRGAAFVDFGQVWQRDATDGNGRPALGDLVFTPGLGIRYSSPIGPIRVDVAYNTQGGELLPVITTRLDESGANTTTLQPLSSKYSWNPRQGVWDRLQLHFSIGQAF